MLGQSHSVSRPAPFGSCIYCGTTGGPLSDEHVLPLALQIPGMNWLLPEAVCPKCQKDTHAYEARCLRAVFGPLRYRMGLKSRRRTPDTVTMTILIEGDRRERRIIPSARYPIICPGLDLPPPSFLLDPTPKSQLFGDILFGYSTTEIRSLFPDAIGVDVPVNPRDFVRFIAKIAHSYICADFREVAIKPFLIDFVLGKSVPVAHLIGSDTSPGQPNDDHLTHHIHRLDFDRDGKRLVGVSIRLFANLRMPRYHVVVGEAL